MIQQGILDFTGSYGKKAKKKESGLSDLIVLREKKELDIALCSLDAHRIKISHVYDKLSSLSNSRTRLLPHQLEATHRVASAFRPRFILGDEVGLGKTIEAGLVMKELILRRAYKRVFVAVPAPLTVQWLQEMKNKFNEDFVILNRKNYAEISASWKDHPRIITSIDFVKNPRYGEDILKEKWDIAVFDEAHRLRRDYFKSTKAYAFAEAMANQTDALLLLSATPFRGKLEELYFFIKLVDPHLLGPYNSFVQEYVMPSRDGHVNEKAMADLRDKISRVLVRRRKVEVGGFTKRFACTIRFDLTPEERLFYDATTDYVKREYNLALQKKNRAIGFVMIVFQKLLDSSTRALLRALERRKAMLEQRMHGIGSAMGYAAGNPFLRDNSDSDSMDPDSLMEYIEELDDLEDLTGEMDSEYSPEMTLKDMRREILTLSHLIELGRSIRQDKKLIKLKDTMLKLRKQGHKKFIVFTQFRSTQDYITEELSKDFRITPFHGSLNIQEKEDAVAEFKADSEIFLSTEAGGEGRNLQFCNCLINYDLPWAPLKVEQRIGRIHRFGQEKDVYIFNFSTKDTVAERVLEVLEQKIKLFEESIGPSDSILGAVEDDGNFQRFLMQFVTGVKTKADFEAELESMMHIAETGYTKINELVTPQLVDFNLDDYYAYTKSNRKLENDEIEQIVLDYLELSSDDTYTLKINTARRKKGERAPGEYLLIENDGAPRASSFQSESALENDRLDFLAVGHPLVDRSLEYFLKNDYRKSVLILPETAELKKGYHFIALVHYRNGLSRSDLFGCSLLDDGSVEMHQELPFSPGFRTSKFQYELDRLRMSRMNEIDSDKLELAWEKARKLMIAESSQMGENLKEKLHSIFKKEEYKLEISYFKKIRNLEEKRDRQKMRYHQEPKTENRSVLTRTENELVRTRQEMEIHLERIRREGRVETELDLLQVFCVV